MHTPVANGIDRALVDQTGFRLDAAHARLCAERDAAHDARSLWADGVRVGGELHDGPALRRRIGDRRQRRRLDQRLHARTADRMPGGGMAVAERDRAGLVEKKRVDIAGRLDSATGHGEHIEAHEAIHPGDADR